MEVARGDIVLCRFFFSDLLTSKNRPVLVLKDNLPFNDFVAIPVSSRIQVLHKDEIEIGPEHFIQGDIRRYPGIGCPEPDRNRSSRNSKRCRPKVD